MGAIGASGAVGAFRCIPVAHLVLCISDDDGSSAAHCDVGSSAAHCDVGSSVS